MLETGTLLDSRYEVLRHLGSGAMATVYLARHVGLLSFHAVKVLEPHLARDEDLRARFLAEGRIQAQLRHPNIVSVTDIVTAGLAGLVLEYLEGPTLERWLQERAAPLETAEILDVLLPILDAVGSAHARGIVHRDLKPGNVILSRHPDGRLRPMVTDFGIAKVLSEEHVQTGRSRTLVGVRMGTLHYMSPEQVRGSADLDARSDLFSLGAILFEMATGQPAFASDTEYDTMRRIVEGVVETPERHLGHLPPGLAACVRQALAREPADRFGSCASFATALLAAGATASPEAPPPPRDPPRAPAATMPAFVETRVEAPPSEASPHGQGPWSIDATILDILASKGRLQAHDIAWEVESRGLRVDRARVLACLRGTLSGRVRFLAREQAWAISDTERLLERLPGLPAPPPETRPAPTVGIPRVYPLLPASPTPTATHLAPAPPSALPPASALAPPAQVSVAAPPQDAIAPDPTASPLLSAALSLCLPGLGQAANRQVLKGVILLGGSVLLATWISPWVLTALLPLVAADAWIVASRRRSGRWVSRLGI